MPDDHLKPCYVCGTSAEKYQFGQTASVSVNCPVCGEYVITHQLVEHLRGLNGQSLEPREASLLPFLSAHIRQATTRPMLTLDNWRAAAEQQAQTPISTKLRLLLELIASRSTPGRFADLLPREAAPRVSANGWEELEYLLKHLAETELIERHSRPDVAPSTGSGVSVLTSIPIARLTVKGWETVSPIGGNVAGRCFVAMSFHESLTPAFENGIKPAIEVDCGFSAYRVDQSEHNDQITDKIIGGILSSQFLVADFTGQRQGVYFEAGYAKGLGRPVIWACHADEANLLHFDTRQYNHVLWKTPAELRVKLTDRIRATIAGARLQ
jgi:hypothetical protein